MRRTYLAGLAAVALLAGLAGCGRRLHPVEGQLVWADGRPATELAGSMVYFESAEHHTVSRSSVGADGRFRLTTERPEAGGPDGVPPGVHRVYVVDGEPSLVDQTFRNPATSGLEVTVPPDGPVVLRVARARHRPTKPVDVEAEERRRQQPRNPPSRPVAPP
jgi:hypothetical protein